MPGYQSRGGFRGRGQADLQEMVLFKSRKVLFRTVTAEFQVYENGKKKQPSKSFKSIIERLIAAPSITPPLPKGAQHTWRWPLSETTFHNIFYQACINMSKPGLNLWRYENKEIIWLEKRIFFLFIRAKILQSYSTRCSVCNVLISCYKWHQQQVQDGEAWGQCTCV